MDKEQLFNDGVNLLESFLKKYLKDKNILEEISKSYYISAPKIEKDATTVVKIRFPIYLKNENESANIIEWMIFDLETFAFINYENNQGQDTLEIEKLKYEIFKEQIIEFVQLFYISNSLKRYEVDSAEYAKNKKMLHEKAEEYMNKNSENKMESFEEVEGMDDELSEQILDEYDVLINRLNAGNSENKRYNFTWKENNDLRYVSDETLELAYKLIEKGQFSLEPKFTEKESNVVINSYVCSFCGDTKYNMTEKELINILNQGSKEINIFINNKASWQYGVNSKGTFNDCKKCKYQKCPKVIAAYILYLKNTGSLKEKLEDRKKFRKENEVNDYFEFVWKSKDGLKKVSDEIFNYCNELVNQDMVCLRRELYNGRLRIDSKLSCEEYRVINCDSNNIPKDRKWENYKILSRTTDVETTTFCGSFSCRLDACPYLIAGYIYYLKKAGKENEIIEDRKYYAENKEQIDIEIKNNKLKEIERIEKEKIKKLDTFNEYKENVKNIDVLLENLTANYQKNLHCIISRK